MSTTGKRKGAGAAPRKRMALLLRAWYTTAHEGGKITCAYCGVPLVPRAHNSHPRAAELDHYRPVARDGDNDPGNMLVCCARCNRAKGARTPRAWWAYVREHYGWPESRIRDAQVRVRSQLTRALDPFTGWATRIESNPGLTPGW